MNTIVNNSNRKQRSIYIYYFFALFRLLFVACSPLFFFFVLCFCLCLSVSCFQFSVPCSLSINRAQLLSDRANCTPRVGGLRSPEASVLALRGVAPGSHVHASYAGEQLSPIYKNMFSVRYEISPFTSTHFEPIGDCGAVFNLQHAST